MAGGGKSEVIQLVQDSLYKVKVLQDTAIDCVELLQWNGPSREI